MHYRSLLLVWIPALLAACQSGNQPSGETTAASSASAPAAPAPEAPAIDAQSCYRAVSGRDSVVMHLHRTGDSLRGDLTYTFFQKDRNTGTLAGRMHGDTLFAEYTFQSEGQTSIREVAFLVKDEALVEGFGPVKDEAGKMVFEDKSKLNFNQKLTYQKVDCQP